MTARARLGALVIVAAAPLSACDAQQQQPDAIDEASIDNVWHKAKLRGVSFRAVGQEPAWLLEIIEGQEILLVTDYGENRTSLPYVDPVVHQEERRTQYILDGYETEIEIRGKPCRDVMSGEHFAVSVTIQLGDQTMPGCGRALY